MRKTVLLPLFLSSCLASSSSSHGQDEFAAAPAYRTAGFVSQQIISPRASYASAVGSGSPASTQPSLAEPRPAEGGSLAALAPALPDTTAPAAAVAPDADQPLSVEELERMALASNPSLVEARARVRGAQGEWLQVGLKPNTILGYSGQQLGSDGLAEQRGLYIGQQFVLGRKLELNRQVAAQDIQKAEQQLAAQERRVRTDVRLAYNELLIAGRRIEIIQHLVEMAAEARRTAEELLRAQEVSRLDLIRAQVELQKSELSLRNAHNTQQAAWNQLTAVVGLPQLRFRPLAGPIPGLDQAIDGEAILNRILYESPELAAAHAEVERARRAWHRARAEVIPNLDLQAIVQNDRSTGGNNVSVQATMPIPWANRNQGGIQQAAAEITKAEQAVARLELALRHQWAVVYRNYANARDQIDEYSREDGILENARETLDILREAYHAGETNYLDLITAQRTYSEVNLAFVESLAELWSASVELEGILLRGSLATEIR